MGVVLSMGDLTFLWGSKLVLKCLESKYLVRLKKKIAGCKIIRRKWRTNKIGFDMVNVTSASIAGRWGKSQGLPDNMMT